MSNYGPPPPYDPSRTSSYYPQQQPNVPYPSPYDQYPQYPGQPPPNSYYPQQPSLAPPPFIPHGTYTPNAHPVGRNMDYQGFPPQQSNSGFKYPSHSRDSASGASQHSGVMSQQGMYPRQPGMPLRPAQQSMPMPLAQAGVPMQPQQTGMSMPPRRVTEAEIRTAAEQTFRRFDADGSGYLDLQEFMDALRALHVAITYHEALECFAGADTNEDGRIGREEFENVYLMRRSH